MWRMSKEETTESGFMQAMLTCARLLWKKFFVVKLIYCSMKEFERRKRKRKIRFFVHLFVFLLKLRYLEREREREK